MRRSICTSSLLYTDRYKEGWVMTLGRPREFDKETAIVQAMRLFWRKGYEGTSMSDLTDELGITRTSIYAAFGNKESLFLKVLDRYDQETAHFIDTSLNAPTSRAVAEGLLYGACAFHSETNNPAGCLMVHGALVGDDISEAVRKETRERRNRLTDRITERLARAQVEGDLRQNAKPAALARYLVSVLRGIAVEAASGAKPDGLRDVADIALTAWPS
ncbi:MAG: TetR/AcrR family transcriptional regulator [Mesorhizobium sp.]